MRCTVLGASPSSFINSVIQRRTSGRVTSCTMANLAAKRSTSERCISCVFAAERAFNKLARTFAAQVEALRRHRTGGEQKVTVEHVTVNEGGQAIVGNVSHGGRGASKNRRSTS